LIQRCQPAVPLFFTKRFLPLPPQVGVHYELSEEEKFYRNALTRMPDGPAALEEAYNSVEDNVSEVEQYVKVRDHLALSSR